MPAGVSVPLGSGAAASGPLGWWLVLAAPAAVAVIAAYGAFRALARARLVEDLPTSRVRSAALGYVELTGMAELLPGPPILAPLSGRRCVWYRYHVEELRRGAGGRRTGWETVEQGVSDGLFRLEDGTGSCVVDPDHAEVFPAQRDRWRGVTRRPGAPPPRRRWAWAPAGPYRYREEIIRPGDPLHAVGELRTVGGVAEPVPAHQDVRGLLADWKRDPARMRTFDADGDGQVDGQEWEAARRAAERAVTRARSERAAEPGVALLARPTDRRRPFILSAVRQAGLARRYRLSALGRLGLSILASAAWLYLLRGQA